VFGCTRLRAVTLAGLFDSFWLSVGWTVFILHAAATHGLAAAGLFGAAMLIGVAMSAPAASALASRLGGRGLLRSTSVGEAVLRVSAFALLLADAPLAVVAAAVTLTNVVGWTAYAGMRAEVAAIDARAATMTSFVVAVASIEALGVAGAALLPVDLLASGAPLLSVVVGLYGAAVLPIFLIAAASPVPRSGSLRPGVPTLRRARPLAGGFAVMALASAPTLLSAALALEFHGRTAVAASALAFTVGSLLAPRAAGALARSGHSPLIVWPALGIGMLVGWVLAPWHVAGLVLAQALSGVSMSAFEGTMDVRVVEAGGRRDVTSALAWAAAMRALGSALAIGVAPALIAATSFQAVGGGLTAVLGTCVLVGMAIVVIARSPVRRQGHGRQKPVDAQV